MRGEAVPQRVRGRRLDDAGPVGVVKAACAGDLRLQVRYQAGRQHGHTILAAHV